MKERGVQLPFELLGGLGATKRSRNDRSVVFVLGKEKSAFDGRFFFLHGCVVVFHFLRS